MATPTAGGILRIGSYAGIAGALLGLVGNLLHPATPIGDPEGVARTIADSRLWVPDHLAIVLGLILMLGGLVAIAHSIQDGLPAALARLGSVAAVAGITVGLILVTLDGLAAKGIAEAWATAPVADQAAALQLVAAEETLASPRAKSSECASATLSLSVLRAPTHFVRAALLAESFGSG